jgi:hypothetical protein
LGSQSPTKPQILHYESQLFLLASLAAALSGANQSTATAKASADVIAQRTETTARGPQAPVQQGGTPRLHEAESSDGDDWQRHLHRAKARPALRKVWQKPLDCAFVATTFYK